MATLTIKVPERDIGRSSPQLHSPSIAPVSPERNASLVLQEGWNARNELKLPLKFDVNLDKINLDFDSPRMKQAMRNLGMTRTDLD